MKRKTCIQIEDKKHKTNYEHLLIRLKISRITITLNPVEQEGHKVKGDLLLTGEGHAGEYVIGSKDIYCQ